MVVYSTLTGHSAFFNGITYVMPKVPTLYSVLSTGSAASDPAIYGTNTHVFVLQKGDIIDIVLNNDDTGKHPFHLHGHAFQVISRSAENAGHYNASNHTAFPQTPMRRDTLYVLGGGHFVVRFRADNPGNSIDEPFYSLPLTVDCRCMALPLPYRVAHGFWASSYHGRSTP